MIKHLIISAFLLLASYTRSQTCNLDFEANSFSGWTLQTGNPSLSTNYLMTGCCSTPGNTISSVVTTPLNDPYLGLLPQSPLGGNFVAKVHGDWTTSNGKVSRITNTFVVGSNSVFQFALAGIVDGIGESCSSISYIHVRILDNTSSPVYSTHFVPVGPNTSTCSFAAFTHTVAMRAMFCWQTYSVNLAPYIGTSVSVEVTAGNCGGTGHWAYCYFDAACSLKTPTSVTCAIPTSITEITEQPVIQIWPNPSKDVLNLLIHSKLKNNELIIYDVLGKVIVKQKDLEDESKIDISKLLPGTYFYKFSTPEETKTGKFIKE